MRGRNVLIAIVGAGLIGFGAASEKGVVHWPGQDARFRAAAPHGSITSFPGPCNKPVLASNPVSPHGLGQLVTFTAKTAGCASPQWRFWIQAPGERWSLVQDYSSRASFSWSTAGLPPGTYGLEVDVRDSSSSDDYDSVANFTDSLVACTSARLTPNAPSPQRPGTSISLTASASCAGNAEYRFWIRPPGGRWALAQNYSRSSSFVWVTAGQPSGSYGLEVDVRDQGSTAAYETVASLTYVISGTALRTGPR